MLLGRKPSDRNDVIHTAHRKRVRDVRLDSVDISVKVGRRIRYLRTQRDLYQADLAAQAKITRETLSRIENGRIDVTLRMLSRIADALGVPIRQLFDNGK
jgi:DNA-binding XRE family transcriptional regulator